MSDTHAIFYLSVSPDGDNLAERPLGPYTKLRKNIRRKRRLREIWVAEMSFMTLVDLRFIGDNSLWVLWTLKLNEGALTLDIRLVVEKNQCVICEFCTLTNHGDTNALKIDPMKPRWQIFFDSYVIQLHKIISKLFLNSPRFCCRNVFSEWTELQESNFV